ncbi:MAG: sugar phosphate isomerase/epimerase [Opitutaceae bacterium]|nr:sugar phosphate isomerase/epimerase [Opitutaceae bacterium]
MNRRQFTRTTLAATLAAMTLPRSLHAAGPAGRRYLSTIGLQLWTVRNPMAQNAAATLRAVKDAGYVQVELMNTASAAQIAPLARDVGLQITSSMIDWTSIVTPSAANVPPLSDALATAKAHGLKYLVFGYIGKGHRETVKQMSALAAAANTFGRQCREAGVQLCYHHHSFEFAPLDGGKTTGWDVFVGEFDPALVKFEIDVFWAAIGGLDPVKTLRDLKGRVAQVHLKDLAKGTATEWDEGKVPAGAFKELGQGGLDMRRIIEVCDETGVDQCHVEQDQSPDVLASIVTSAKYLRV